MFCSIDAYIIYLIWILIGFALGVIFAIQTQGVIMDKLKLCWEMRPARLKKFKTETFLAVYVNDISIAQLLQTAAENNNTSTLGDEFLSMALVQKLEIDAWKQSCIQDSVITLMACACGQWECSTVSIKTCQQDNWVHWQFNLNAVYKKNYGELPEFWFDAKDYASALQVLDEVNAF